MLQLYEMLKLSIWSTRFETNYSSCTVRSSENICSSRGGAAEEKGKTGWNSVYHQSWWFSEFHPPLNANVLLCRFFFNLTLCMTKLRVLVLCVSYFAENSNVPVFISNSGPNNKPKLPLKVGLQFFFGPDSSVKQALYTLKKLSWINMFWVLDSQNNNVFIW